MSRRSVRRLCVSPAILDAGGGMTNAAAAVEVPLREGGATAVGAAVPWAAATWTVSGVELRGGAVGGRLRFRW